MASLGFLYITSCHSNRNHLISFILVWMPPVELSMGEGKSPQQCLENGMCTYQKKKKKEIESILHHSQKNSLKWTGD